jgi:hypothetical protein
MFSETQLEKVPPACLPGTHMPGFSVLPLRCWSGGVLDGLGDDLLHGVERNGWYLTGAGIRFLGSGSVQTEPLPTPAGI